MHQTQRIAPKTEIPKAVGTKMYSIVHSLVTYGHLRTFLSCPDQQMANRVRGFFLYYLKHFTSIEQYEHLQSTQGELNTTIGVNETGTSRLKTLEKFEKNRDNLEKH